MRQAVFVEELADVSERFSGFGGGKDPHPAFFHGLDELFFVEDRVLPARFDIGGENEPREWYYLGGGSPAVSPSGLS